MGGKRVSEGEYIQSLKGRDIEYVSGYLNTQIKCLHRCKIDGHEWETAPENIRCGKGCPKCGGKLPVTEAEYIQSLEGRDIEYISGYVNMQTHCLHRCKVDGNEWLAKPKDIRQGKGCPSCAGNKKVSEADYIKSLKIKSINYVTGYVNAMTPCLHSCKIDGHEWLVRPDSIRRGSGCPECGNVARVNEVEYTKYLEGRDIEYVTGYVNTYTKCLHRCKIDGHEWTARPNGIRRGYGCPKCAKRGFQIGLTSTIYFLMSEEGCMKIGITGEDTARRFIELGKRTPFSFTLYGQYKSDGETIAKLEKSLHRRLKKHHAGLKGFDGATEWFHANREVLELVNRVSETGSVKKPLPKEVNHVRPKMSAVPEQRAE